MTGVSPRRDSSSFAQSTIDALASHICVLNEAGVIVSVNRAWRNFEQANRAQALGEEAEAESVGQNGCCEGANYLEVCDSTVGPDAAIAGKIATVIRDFLKGECDPFSMEYPCHSPTEQRWFLCRVSRFTKRRLSRIVIEHISITERKQTENALRESDERFRIMADGCPAIIWVTDAEGRNQFINDSYRKFGGATDGNSKEQKWQVLLHPDDRPAYVEMFRRAVCAQAAFKGEARVRRADGEWRWLASYGEPRLSATGEFLGHVGLSVDITERKRAEQALQRTEEKFRQFTDTVRQVIWMVPLDPTERHFVSPAYEAIWGRSCESLYLNPTSWMEAVHPDDREEAERRFAAELLGIPADSEYRILTPDGHEKWIHDRAFPIRDESGKMVRVAGIAEEITERKSYEAALVLKNRELEASEARYRKLLDLSPDAIIVGRNQSIALANKAAVELFGVSSASELIGKRFADFVSADSRDVAEQVIEGLYEREMQNPLRESRFRHSDGQLFDVEVASSSFRENGEMVVQTVIRNISQRKQAEAEHARLVRSIEQVSESVIITDPDGAIVYVNPAFETVTGYSRGEAIGANPSILKSGRHPAAFYEQMWATLLRGETWSGDLINKRKDGTIYYKVTTISPIKDHDGSIVNFVSVSRDMTAERLLRDQLSQSQKLESMGRLAGGVAHDFNNLLMVIQAYTEILHSRLPADDSLRNYAEQIMKAAERGAGLTRQMLAFSRKQIILPVVLDLNAVIEEAAKMLKRVIGEDIELRVIPAATLWRTEADPDQIFQILMNLSVNSRDAMPRGGTLTIETRNATVGNENVAELSFMVPGEYVVLSVSDTGAGISKEVQQRIFDPFFTTKEVGKGTGLGLATVYGIAKQSGGYVTVNSELGLGASFSVYLPRVERAATASRMPPKDEAPLGGTETLLVVEDEDQLRESMSEFLRNQGYTVLVARSGSEAMKTWDENEHIDLLLTDVVMPNMSGRELSQMLGALCPDLKIIHMSGYTDDAVLRYGIKEMQFSFLQKPFSLSTLARRVRETLDGTESAACVE